MLTEVTPNTRVLSGEIIIFQNETQEIFRDLINGSTIALEPAEANRLNLVKKLPVRYVLTILFEYLRSLLENKIPLPPAQQTLII